FNPPQAHVNCEAVRDNSAGVRNTGVAGRNNPEGIRAAKWLFRTLVLSVLGFLRKGGSSLGKDFCNL
ncbi:hypothetical protein, partial [Kosmotoga sp.]|uniref:hypothetical protein n=1 Tax=Kosmotoga sp. TaxID=1955248 RepID=UPI002589619C